MMRTTRGYALWALLLAVVFSLVLSGCNRASAESSESAESAAWTSTARPAVITQQIKDIDKVVEIFSGVWKLRKRTNPDGSVWSDVEGTTTISLEAHYAKFGSGHRALGSITAQESGTLDPRCAGCVPPESKGQKFQIESAGTWAVSLLDADDPNYKSTSGKDYAISVVTSSRIEGNYVPYKDGLNSTLTSYMRLDRESPNASLLKDVTFAVDGPRPRTDSGQLISSAELATSS